MTMGKGSIDGPLLNQKGKRIDKTAAGTDRDALGQQRERIINERGTPDATRGRSTETNGATEGNATHHDETAAYTFDF